MINLPRRRLLRGMLAAPAIILTPGLLMQIKPRVIVPAGGYLFMPGKFVNAFYSAGAYKLLRTIDDEIDTEFIGADRIYLLPRGR